MPLAAALAAFNATLSHCDRLIASAHRQNAHGVDLFPQDERESITNAAFLNMFIAWETFLEEALIALMVGNPTSSGRSPTRFVSPTTEVLARKIVLGTMNYFDFGNHDNVRRLVYNFFDQGYPFDPHLVSIMSDLADMKTIRNRCAHLSSSTQSNLDRLALRLLASPNPGITPYALLMAIDPINPGSTVYANFRAKLVAAATQIANG